MNTLKQALPRMAADPAFFRQVITIDADGRPKLFKPDWWQDADFKAVDPAWLRLAGKGPDVAQSRAWLERPRGHSKTSDTAISVLWAMKFVPRALHGIVAAHDKDQAALLRLAIKKLCQLNPWLGDKMDVQRDKVINLRTGSELEILSSDASSAFGRTPDFVILDELTHWSNQDLWLSLFSAVAKRDSAVLQVITNAGFCPSWQWDLREEVRNSPEWHFHALDCPKASWITPRRLAEQQRLLPGPAYNRLWLNQWTDGSGDALSVDEITRAIRHPGPMLAHEPGWTFCAGLDLGLSRDHCGLAIVAKHIGFTRPAEPIEQRGTIQNALVDLGLLHLVAPEAEPQRIEGTHVNRLANIASWKPGAGKQIDLSAVEKAVFEAHQRFGLVAVLYDPWQCALMAQRLRRMGVPMVETQFTAKNLNEMATTLLERFRDCDIEIYNDPQLVADLKALKILERSYGVRLDAARGASGHADRAVALCLALLGLRRHGPRYAELSRPLLHEGLMGDVDPLDLLELEEERSKFSW